MRAAGARRWKSLGNVVFARRFAADAYTGPSWGQNAAPANYGSAYPGAGGEGGFQVGGSFARQGDGDQAPQQTVSGRQNYGVHGSQSGAGNVVPQGEARNGFSYEGAASQQLGAGFQGEGAQGSQYGAGNLRQGEVGHGFPYGAGTQQNIQHLGSSSGAQGSQQSTGNVRQLDSGYGFPYAGAGIHLNDAQRPGVGQSDALHGSQFGAGSVMSASSGYGVPQSENGLRDVQGSGAVEYPNTGSFGSQLPQQGYGPQNAGAHSSSQRDGAHFRPLSDQRQMEAAPRPQLQNGPDSFASFNRPRAGQRERSPSPPPYSQSGDSSSGSLGFQGSRQEVSGQNNLRNSVSYTLNGRPLDGGSNSPTITTSNQASESGGAQSSPASSGWRAPNAPSAPAQTSDHSSFSATGRAGRAAQNLQLSVSSGREIRPPAVTRNGNSEPTSQSFPFTASQSFPSSGDGNLWQSSPPQSNRLLVEDMKSPAFPSRNQSSESQRTSAFSGNGQPEGGPPSESSSDDRQRSPSFAAVAPSSHAGSNPSSLAEVSPLPYAGIVPGGLSSHTRDQQLDNPVPSARPHESGRTAPPFIQDVVKGLSRSASTPPLSEQSMPPVPPLVLQGAPSAGVPRKVLARLSNAPRFALKSDIVSYFEGCNLKEEDVEFLYDDNYRLRFIHIDFDSQDIFGIALKTLSAKGRFGGKFMKLEQDSPIELDRVNLTVQSLRGHGLLMQNLPSDVVMEDVDKFFQGYGLGMRSVRFLRSTWLPGYRPLNEARSALVQFDSYLNASRALREKQGQFCGSRAVELRYLQ